MYFFLRTCCYCVKAWLLGFWFYISLLHCFAYITFFFSLGVLLLSFHKQNTALVICPSVACSDMWNVRPGPNHRRHFSVVLIIVSLFCCLLAGPMLWILKYQNEIGNVSSVQVAQEGSLNSIQLQRIFEDDEGVFLCRFLQENREIHLIFVHNFW